MFVSLSCYSFHIGCFCSKASIKPLSNATYRRILPFYQFFFFFCFLLAAILLGHLKMPFEEIKQALMAMDKAKFTETHLNQLFLYAPDKEEVTANLLEPYVHYSFHIISMNNSIFRSKFLLMVESIIVLRNRERIV